MVQKFNFDSEEILPFHGYRAQRTDGNGFERGEPEMYSSLEHFYQSEKFRGVDNDYRRHIMSLPTAREARKAGRKLPGRADWEIVHARVMACGIWLKMREHMLWRRSLAAHSCDLENSYSLPDRFWKENADGSPVSRYDSLILGTMEKMRKGSMRVLVTGSRSFSNYFVMQTRLDSVFARSFPDEIVIACSPGADSMAERWAIENQVPVRHFQTVGRTGREQRHERDVKMLRYTTHVVAFWMDNSPGTCGIIKLAESMGKNLRMIRMDAQGKTFK